MDDRFDYQRQLEQERRQREEETEAWNTDPVAQLEYKQWIESTKGDDSAEH